MRISNNKRSNAYSFSLTEKENELFKKLWREAEDMSDERLSASEYIRHYMVMPYIECHTIPDRPEDTSPSVPDSKPDTEQTVEPVIYGKYAHLLEDV